MGKNLLFVILVIMTAAAAYGGGGQAVSAGPRETEIVIPEGVTSIGEGEYTGQDAIKVVIPNSVVSIGFMAFSGNKLSSIVIPDSVTSIGEQVFFGNNNLTSITLPANVQLETDALPCQAAYEENGKQAGTYTLKNGNWTYRR